MVAENKFNLYENLNEKLDRSENKGIIIYMNIYESENLPSLGNRARPTRIQRV